MKKLLLAGVAVLAIAGTTVVYAQQHRPWIQEHMRMSPEDRAAFADARIAGGACRPQADARPGKAVAAARGRGAGFRQDAD